MNTFFLVKSGLNFVICGVLQIENLIFEIDHPLLLDFELLFFKIIYCRFNFRILQLNYVFVVFLLNIELLLILTFLESELVLQK